MNTRLFNTTSLIEPPIYSIPLISNEWSTPLSYYGYWNNLTPLITPSDKVNYSLFDRKIFTVCLVILQHYAWKG